MGMIRIERADITVDAMKIVLKTYYQPLFDLRRSVPNVAQGLTLSRNIGWAGLNEAKR